MTKDKPGHRSDPLLPFGVGNSVGVAVGVEPGVDDWRTVATDQTYVPGQLNGVRLGRAVKWLAILIGAMAMAVGGLAIVVLFDSSATFNPLGTYPTQKIVNGTPDPTTGLPMFTVDQEVLVEGTKCNASDAAVDVFGVLTWRSIEPAGSVLRVAEGTAVREPGCDTRLFRNPVPAVVVDRTADLFAAGVDHVTWVIAGWEIPLGPDGAEGARRQWTTEPFTFVPSLP